MVRRGRKGKDAAAGAGGTGGRGGGAGRGGGRGGSGGGGGGGGVREATLVRVSKVLEDFQASDAQGSLSFVCPISPFHSMVSGVICHRGVRASWG